MIQLGDKAQDKITLFEGIVTGKCLYISGCDQILIQPQGLKEDGEKKSASWIDIDRCKLIEAGVFKTEDVSSVVRPGCDPPAPIR